jgi:hypothetical protein
MHRYFPFFALLLFFPATARADEITPKPAKVPFDLLKTQHMVVQVKINGQGPYRLIFDTGAPVTLINNKIAKEAGVFPKDFKRPPFALFGSMGQFKMKELEVGGLKADNIPTMVMDHPTVTAISNALGPIEGIVGFSFFARYRMTIDYQAKEMTFVPNNFNPPDMMETLMKTLSAPSTPKRKILAPGGLIGLRVHKETGDDQAGVTIQEVFPNSPAAKAGLQMGDRLLTLDGRWTDTVVECYEAASKVPAGAEARVTIQRGNKEKTLMIMIQPGL